MKIVSFFNDIHIIVLLFICFKKNYIHIHYLKPECILYGPIQWSNIIFYIRHLLKRIPKQLISPLRALTPPFQKGVVNKLNLVNPLFFTSFNKTILLLKLYFKVSVITGYKDLFDIIMKEGAHKFHQF